MADIFLLDYRYTYLNLNTYTSHQNYNIDLVKKWCNIDLLEVNEVMLERSYVFYKPNKNLQSIETKDGPIDSLIRPILTIYYDENIELNVDLDFITNSIGKLISVYFGKIYIDINDLENSIKQILPDNPLSVKVEYGGTGNIIKILSENRFRIKKKINSSGDLVYDIDVVIKRI